MSKKIYILLATYNGGKYLKEQLDSLFEQTNQHWTLWIHDDNSKDNTVSIIKEYQSKYSNKIKFLDDNISTGGAKENFTYLINNIDEDYDYVMFCDQDDVWYSDKIEKTLSKMKELENESTDLHLLVHSDLTVVNENLNVIASSFWSYQHIDPSKDSLNRLLLHNVVTGCTMMINRALAEKVKTIPDEAIMHDWWIALVASIFGKIAYIDEPLMLYRQHGKNDTGAKKYGFYYVCNRLFMKFYTKKYTSQLDKYILQSNKFLEIYQNDLNDKNKTILQAFQQFSTLNKLQKVGVLFKYKLWKNGFIRNLGLILFV